MAGGPFHGWGSRYGGRGGFALPIWAFGVQGCLRSTAAGSVWLQLVAGSAWSVRRVGVCPEKRVCLLGLKAGWKWLRWLGGGEWELVCRRGELLW
ncbi:hypothetical protein OIU74_030220 [Salix koriyanagi]|uniref:Uncharacterized protein n=1 Tax=Salix koriyanagi TaxID=2511006 RepID=A0A9Q0ZV01_9ROSI|nr:hypothetical protein OIU74_030220 [Salix koriyanagi]